MNKEIIMEILNFMNIKLTEDALIELIKSGTLIEEIPMKNYIIAKNINEALNDRKNEIKLLKQNLDKETFDELKNAYIYVIYS